MAPNPPKRMGRPDDVPSWGECFRRAWHWTRWNLIIVPVAPVLGLIVNHYAFKDPNTPAEAASIQAMNDLAIYGLPIVALVLWMLILLGSLNSERMAKTPKEVEELERNRLAYLKNKYPD